MYGLQPVGGQVRRRERRREWKAASVNGEESGHASNGGLSLTFEVPDGDGTDDTYDYPCQTST